MTSGIHLRLPVPDRFPAFPYDPYSIQVELMQHIYSSIESRQVAVVESPTGTGKTMSLLCSALTWLADEKERAMKGRLLAHTAYDTGSKEPDWVVMQSIEKKKRELDVEKQEYEQRLATARKKELAFRKMARAKVTKKLRPTHEVEVLDDDIFLPEDGDIADSVDGDNLSPTVRVLREKYEKSYQQNPSVLEEPTCTKIFYASRTHSQLSQIIPELSKLKFTHTSLVLSDDKGNSMMRNSELPGVSAKKRPHDFRHDNDGEGLVNYPWRTVSLGSRKQLCVNDDLILKRGDIDEKCREMIEKKSNKRCEYLPPSEEEHRMLDLRDQILAFPKDIEDLATTGRNAHTCPYYGSRKAIPQAELVTLPYNLLLQKSAREALGIDLSDQIVVIDEAHNLITTLLSLSSVRLTCTLLTASLSQLSGYFRKFRIRLSAIHALHLKRLIAFMESVQAYINDWKTSKKSCHNPQEKTEVMTPQEFMQNLGRNVEGINLLEILSYLKNSKIARKITSYTEMVAAMEAKEKVNDGVAPLHRVEDFMRMLASASEDGRIILSVDESHGHGQVEMKYQLLNPCTIFREITDVARSVILAGGTMSPIQDIINQLFPHLPLERLSSFSCGHIVPASNIQTLVVSKGPCGDDLEFSYRNQSDKSLMADLGQVIFNLCSVVPGGLVVFFPSYSYLNAVKAEWASADMMKKFEGKKRVFLEPQDSSEVENILRKYAAEVRSVKGDRQSGALLLAVIGAKLSEGLNFSDDLARAVVVIGLPFANKTSPELRERMKYVSEAEIKKGNQKRAGKDAATELYENMCMNAVNQSIGRAIRHRSDWATLVLVDRRYRSPAIQAKLPKWIGKSVVVTETYGQTVKHLGNFYREKKALRATSQSQT